MNAVTLAFKDEALVGECPVWDEHSASLYWLDCKAPRLTRWTPATGAVRTWPLREWTGSFALRSEGGFILATASGFWTMSEDGALTQVVDIPVVHDIRLCDGKCDRAGRFWAGELDGERKGPTGSLYRVSPDFSVERGPGKYVVFNGLCWSPDGRTAYAADTWARRIYAYDFDVASGTMTNQRIFVETDGEGMPDGATVDTDGYLWVAMVDGWRLTRFAPDGRVDRDIPVPVKRPTSCTFGGPGLDQLYVTSARTRMSEAELTAQPLAGSVLTVATNCTGLPANRFG